MRCSKPARDSVSLDAPDAPACRPEGAVPRAPIAAALLARRAPTCGLAPGRLSRRAHRGRGLGAHAARRNSRRSASASACGSAPSWQRRTGDAAAIVRIDPGLAFGTGSHPTTRLVLGFLERFVRGGERVLDYGCGSGILAIAAAKLGAGRVDAVDIDPQAVEVTRANAAGKRRRRCDLIAAGGARPRPL